VRVIINKVRPPNRRAVRINFRLPLTESTSCPNRRGAITCCRRSLFRRFVHHRSKVITGRMLRAANQDGSPKLREAVSIPFEKEGLLSEVVRVLCPRAREIDPNGTMS